MSTRFWSTLASRGASRSGTFALFALLTVSGLTASACASADPAGAEAPNGDAADVDESDLTKRGKLRLVVTVDWEGRDLNESNLRAMENLRTRFPQVKIVHFLNAAYFTKPGAVASDVSTRVNRVLRPGDEKGLHIHGWKRLFEASGVTFRTDPTFWGTSIDEKSACSFDCGHEVPINAYTTDELRKVVKFSLDTLETNGFGRAKSFRCGGWVASSNVRDALAAEGIRADHSEVPTPFLQPKLGKLPLYGWLGDIWPTTNETAQPHTIAVQSDAGKSGTLLEIPDNGAMSDYVTTQQMVDVFEKNKAAYKRDPRKDVVVSIGFHQETAATYLPQLEGALTRIFDEATAEKLPLESSTTEVLKAR